jgi:hypothetical protein
VEEELRRREFEERVRNEEWRKAKETEERRMQQSKSRTSSESSGSKSSSRAESIKSKTSRRSQQGDYTATRVTAQAILSRRTRANTWDDKTELEDMEDGQTDHEDVANKRYVEYTLQTNKRRWGNIKGRVKIDIKTNKITDIKWEGKKKRRKRKKEN